MQTEVQQVEVSEDAFVRRVFHDTLDLIHIALVNHYGLVDSEAGELETDLFMWFRRFCQRPGTKSPEESRQFLVVAACEFARDYQRYVVSIGERRLDERLRSILERDPRDVARDFSRGLELIRFRYSHDS
jgi:hypothetical protein